MISFDPIHLNTKDIDQMAQVHWESGTTLARYYVSEGSELLRRALEEEKAAVYISPFAEVKIVYPDFR